MAANTHKIKMLNSEAPAEEVGAATLDYLKENRLLDQYQVSEIKPVSKPTDLDKSKDKDNKPA